ncbi:peptidyl-prolyl cis-trans isomerase D [Rhodobacter sp. JA431]|uniref:SurA N-terminal domain-containing protein n=1 Tax=Rhodobacter sp. JA431 TaxID=570013 RepID=UPI000BDB606E|nr:SurA N-terminal domain-containing protein [Rhodobacter sp. JA431]SOC12974.1 peptidyl-prolyl cis-trans isomerase D [Rhodobacter sp. JA431]
MSTKLRSHGKSVVVWILLAMLIFGLGGYGVSNFSGGVKSIGTVGETEITVQDYANALRQEMNAAAAQFGRPLRMEEARAIGLDRAVQGQLFGAAGLSEQANRLHLSVGDEEVGRQITSAQAFQGPTGQFDRTAYRDMIRRQGYTEAAFEARLRADIARSILQGAVAGGAVAPEVLVNTYTAYLGETRDIAFAEITEDSLPAPVDTPDDAALQAYYEAHISDFTSPEAREITYAWLTPEMMAETVEIDEATLRETYDSRKDEFVQPERRDVSKLVFPTQEEADAGMARIAAGEANLADLAEERGLSANDISLSEQSEADIGGTAGAAVFAATDLGAIGPFETDLGPALFSVDAIYPGEETSFEDARGDIAAELAAERGRRMISDVTSDLEDRLASGATLEEMDKETAMQLGHIAFSAETTDGIAGYEAFREAATAVTAQDFPELGNLADGGVFALRLDGITPATPIPFDQVRDQVSEAWAAAELMRLKKEQADQVVAALEAGTSLADQGLEVRSEDALIRGAFVEGAPQGLAETAFATEPGKGAVVSDAQTVFVVTPMAVHAADMNSPEMQQLSQTFSSRLGQMIGNDLVDFYAAAAQSEAGITLDSAAINAVQAQIQ